MIPPNKPFSNYKWQWAVLTPTEGLNNPPVFFGILRTMAKFEGVRPSEPEFNKELGRIEKQTKTNVRLERTPERNLIRNSGQYWKALDLIDGSHGEIKLTPFGRKVVNGDITPTEFAITVVKTLQLPNKKIDPDVKLWKKAKLKIKPLELLLKILSELYQQHDSSESFITPDELVKIIIPLAGESASIDKHIEALIQYRKGKINISSWPDCAPRSNDKRMAREFLLFLFHYGFCRYEKSRAQQKFYLDSLEPQEIKELTDIRVTSDSSIKILKKIQKSNISENIERKKILAEIFVRPQQAKFRKDVLNAYKNKCIITGTKISTVLQAAHIIPAKDKGKNDFSNGFCFRADIHLLFDSGHLRIDAMGNIHLSESAAKHYKELPKRIKIPRFVDTECIKWRWLYK